MTLQLMLGDDWVIPIPLAQYLQSAWDEQQGRAVRAEALDTLAKRLAASFACSLIDVLDYDLKPPTPAQLSYATSIARDLGVALPAEVLRFRGAMSEFIERFAGAHAVLTKRRRCIE